MDKDSRPTSAESSGLFDETWFDPIEQGIRDRIRGFISRTFISAVDAAARRSEFQADGRVALPSQRARRVRP